MANNAILPVRLMNKYGRSRLPLFYPDDGLDDVSWTYRDVIDLYNDCLIRKDTEALQLLAGTYDIEAMMKFDNQYHLEIPIRQKYTRKERNQQKLRRLNETHYLGGKYYRNLFKKLPDGTVLFSARACIYRMSRDQMISLAELSESNPHFDSGTSLVKMYETMCGLTDRDKLILVYLRYMCNQTFPVEELEALKDGSIRIVDSF